jgi:putative N6-adenine-specific DNA methylase
MYKCFASCAFGLEAVTARELKDLSLSEVDARDARVYFLADEAGIARANLWLRTADRVYIELDNFPALTFDALFEGVRAMHWSDHIPKDAAFIVNADSVGSRLFSVSDIQSIGKKAMAVSLMEGHRVATLPETGIRYDIHLKILRDQVSVCLNTSGQGLNRRGYRAVNVAAPMRETLAAGLVLLSGWRDGALADPMCGSGTIAIEAAMIGSNMAPGLKRAFDAENWPGYMKPWRDEKASAIAQRRAESPVVFASDIDPKAISAADKNARAAGVDIRLFKADVRDFSRIDSLVLINPPYAQRLGERDEVHRLYADMGRALSDVNRKSIITADADFERYFGGRAIKKRKLYNGSIRCTFYQYYR